MDTVIQGTQSQIAIGLTQPTVVVGNRIHAAHNPRIADAVRRMDLAIVQKEARAQAAEGAHVIGIWLGLDDVNEVEMLPCVVEAVTGAVPLPLCIGTSDARALDAALTACPGRPLVSPITAEDISLQELIPVALAHGVAIVGLGWNERGLPRDFEGFGIDFDVPFELTRVVLRRALSAGIPREDILIGVRPRPIAEDPAAAVEALNLADSLSQIEQLGVVVDTSYLSRGLPAPHAVDLSFLTMAMRHGAVCCMLDPAELGKATLIADLLLGRQGAHKRYAQAR